MNKSLHLKFGIGAGLINCIGWYVISRSLTYYEVASIDRYRMLITIALLIIGIFLSIFFQKKENNGYLGFKQGLQTGMLYTLLLAASLAIFNYLYYKYIAPDAVDFFVSEAKKQIISTNTQPANMTKFEEAVRSYFSSFKMFMSTVIMGVVVSVIFSGILRKKSPLLPFSEN